MTWSLSINVLKLGVPQFAFLGTSIYFVALWGFKIQDGEGILVVRCKIKLFLWGVDRYRESLLYQDFSPAIFQGLGLC